ncbi:aminotransferase class III-fold pyridoxal phosphate-dependent enzyme [Amnibacterium endophyticum]|uniref:Aminotransferase class III-fold pyridoxal phosphate-dependent enzyme n=1 Tax=Amnibacterium endophyticum TaxID=2109337 RepID=A0ABW4LG56_9MICO
MEPGTLDLDRAVLHPWSAQASWAPLAIERASGCEVVLEDGRVLLDFSSQLVNTNLGHAHPAVTRAIQQQAAVLPTVNPAHAVRVRGEAAARILEVAGEPFSKVFFTNGGADANENAIRMARLVTGRDKVLSAYRSYHGNTGAAIAATGDWRRVPNEYARGHVHFWGPFPYRSEFWSDSPEQEAERALHALRRLVEAEGPATVAAILVETVPGTAGVIVPPPGWLEGLRALCDEWGILLILDEVMAGFGRTGDWFAFQDPLLNPAGVVPDLITFAKGVNGGAVPVGGVVLPPAIASVFDERVFPGGLTYSGHPLAMASIVATIDAMRAEGVVEHARGIGEDVLGPALRDLAARHDCIGEVRGLGVFWALDLVTDRASKAPLPPAEMARIKRDLVEAGVLPFVQDNRVHVVPPCTVTAEQVGRAIAALDAVLP